MRAAQPGESSGPELLTSESQEEWERSPGFVYFLAARTPPLAIKIGVTKQTSLLQRLRAIQGSNHEPLRLLGLISTRTSERPMVEAERIEKELHRRFAHLQRFQSGWVGAEWFTSSSDILEFIEEHAEDPETYGMPTIIAKPGPGLRPEDTNAE